tara:strand:+ start:192 stop:587 length:396 start_codon:yes stop_codon:yes gene_type:complete
MYFHYKYYPYTVKEDCKKFTVIVFNKGSDNKKPKFKVIIPREIMEKKYKGYTKPSNLYAINIEDDSINSSPENIGYIGYDKIFEIQEEADDKKMLLRLFKQWEWDMFSNKKYISKVTSESNRRFFEDIQNL